MKEAKHFGEVVEIASSSDANYTFYPQVPSMFGPSGVSIGHILP